MTARTLSCPVPENLNPLSPNGYMFSIEKLPSLSFFCQEVNLPSIILPEAQQLNPFTKIPLAGDQLEYGTLTVQFLIDETMTNYRAIHHWLVSLGFPENYSQYTNFLDESKIPGLAEVAKSHSDGTLTILGNNNTQIQTVQFKDLIPESLESITFLSTNQDVQYLVGSVTFKYTYYKFL